jgi:hypothetical protein
MMKFLALASMLFICPLFGADDASNAVHRFYADKEAEFLRYYEQKDFGKAAALLEAVRRDARIKRNPEFRQRATYNLACAYSLLGKTERAIATLRKLVDGATVQYDKLSRDPDFANLRGDRRFHQILETAAAHANLYSLYPARRWFELREAVQKGGAPAFYRVAVVCAFNRLEECERVKQRFIQSEPEQWERCAATNVMMYRYFAAGRFRAALSDYDQNLSRCPGADEYSLKDLVAALSRQPDFSVTRGRQSTVPYRMADGNLTIPVSINGRLADFMPDTGANISMIAESEARRLGMVLTDIPNVPFRDARGEFRPVSKLALADRLVIGNIEFAHVPFMVLGDDSQFQELPPGERGAIGIQVLLACGRLRWNAAGHFEIGFQAGRRTTPKPGGAKAKAAGIL